MAKQALASNMICTLKNW